MCRTKIANVALVVHFFNGLQEFIKDNAISWNGLAVNMKYSLYSLANYVAIYIIVVLTCNS